MLIYVIIVFIYYYIKGKLGHMRNQIDRHGI